MNPILDKYIMVAPAISKLFLSDVGVAVTDREQFVYYQPGKTLDLKVPFGAPVKPNMITYIAMKEKRRVVEKRDADLWGVPFIAWAIPLTDDAGVVIGSLTIQENVEQQEVLTGLASNLANSINLLAATAEQVTAQSQEASAACDSMLEVMRHSQYKVGETDQIVGLIKGIAGQTNLLGLNAAIESTRLGREDADLGLLQRKLGGWRLAVQNLPIRLVR